MNKGLKVNFKQYELSKDYKFVYKISCEPKISPSQDITTITQKIIATRVKMIDEMTIKLLKEIAEEKGYSEILAIDESKVLKIVNDLKDFEWLKSKVSIEWFDKLSTDDKIKLMQIMGWKYDSKM